MSPAQTRAEQEICRVFRPFSADEIGQGLKCRTCGQTEGRHFAGWISQREMDDIDTDRLLECKRVWALIARASAGQEVK